MNFAKNQSLKIFIASFIILLIGIIIVYSYSYNRITKDQLKFADEIVSEISASMEYNFLEKVKTVKAIAIAPVILNALQVSNEDYSRLSEQKRAEEIESKNIKWKSIDNQNNPFILEYTDNAVSKYLKLQQDNIKGEYGEIFITDKYGALIATTAKLTTYAHGNKYWWEGAYNNGEGAVFFDDRGYDDSVGGYVLGVVVPIKNGDEIIGILKANLNVLGSIDSMLLNVNNDEADKLFLMRSDGLIIYKDGVEPLSQRVPERLFEKILINENSFICKAKDLEGIYSRSEIGITAGKHGYRFGGSFGSIDHKKGNATESWYIVDFHPMSHIVKLANKNSWIFLLIGIILSFVLAIMSLIIGNQAAKPIKELIKQTLNISEGDYNSQVSTKRTDEIGQLSLSFNKMTSNLKETTTSLHNLNLEIVERKEAEAKVEMLSRMPSENPHPVLRVKPDGTIIYANEASNVLLQTWKSSIGEKLSISLCDLVYDVYKDTRIKEIEFTAGDQIFSLVIVPIANADLLNIYGRDITEQQHASEVLRQSEATIRNKLKAITEPEGDIELLDLADIVDSDALQLLMEQFYKVVPVASAIGNLSGELMASVGWQDICTKFHRCNPETAKNCHESDTALAGSVPFGEFKAYHCKNNMWDVSAPIEIAGKHFGNILIGQFFYADEEVDINKFKQMARKYGFDEAEYLEALGRVPRLTRQAADAAMAFLSELAKLISHMSFSTIQQSRLLAERELSEQFLRESEAKFSGAFNESPISLSITDFETGETVAINDKFVESFGYSRAEFLRGNLFETNIAVDNRAFMESVDQIKREGFLLDYPFQMVTKNGDVRDLLLSAARISNENNNQFIISHIDVTDRKKAEEELSTSRDLLSTILENIPMRVFWKDTDLRYIGCNTPFALDAGMLHPEDLIGKDDSQMSWSNEAESYNSDDQLVIDSNTPKLSYEEPQTTPDGRTIWLHSSKVPLHDANGQVIGLLGIYDDITDRKLTEEATRRQKNMFELVINSVPARIFWKDLNSVYLGCNMAFVGAVKKNKPEDVIGKNDFDLIWADEAEKYIDDDRQVIKRGIPKLGYEESYVLPDGKMIWWQTSKMPLKDNTGKIIGILSISEDITERKQAEKEHERLQGQLRQAQKMESVGRLAGGVAHDYNNISSIIMGYSELALDKLEQSDPLYGDITEIITATKRSADITQQLLAFARKQTVVPRVLDLNVTIGDLLKMLRRLIGEDIDLAWIPGVEVRSVKIDPSQINQIMANLCVNARDAIDNVGRITVETKNINFDEEYCIDHDWAVSGEYIQLSVSDDGCGMTPETRDKIFEPFFTTKDIGKGTGLGLSTVYGIVKQNNGFVNVYSEIEKGTTFRLYLPIHVDVGKVVKVDSGNTIEFPLSRGETVLLVEDEDSILKIIKRVLEKFGYTVLFSSSPVEAMKLAEKHADEINLLITDVIMPEMNGRDLAERLQSLCPNLKTLFMSGYTADIIENRGVLESGVSFIAKPFSNQELAVKVREVLDGEERVNG
jgi:PAS domain S-box-containing protein